MARVLSRAGVATAVVLQLAAPAAQAQSLKGTLAFGAALSRVEPVSSDLSSTTRLPPTLRRVLSAGLGLVFALNWFDVEVGPAFAQSSVPLGRVRVTPLMLGVGYTGRTGRWALTPSVVAGPSLTSVAIDPRLRDTYRVAGSAFERQVGVVSPAVRAGLSATFAVAPRLGITAFGGYLWHRARVTLDAPGGTIQRPLRTDAVVVETGVVVSIF